MMPKDFWSNATVAVIGGGSWGTVLAALAASHCQRVRLYLREEEQARALNATRTNGRYLPKFILDPKIQAHSDLSQIFADHVHAVIWALPSRACRTAALEVSPYLQGDELILHATKGVEETTLQRISEILGETLPCRRIGVLSGPNLVAEMVRGEPTATCIASRYPEVCEAGLALLGQANFRVFTSRDVVGTEWAGVLKNVYAIASGVMEAQGLGHNSRALLMTLGLGEMIQFGQSAGAQIETFHGLAGMGDLLATCSSPTSRNYRVGYRLAQGENLSSIIEELGGVAEGVQTAASVCLYAEQHGLHLPIAQGVSALLRQEITPERFVKEIC